jgi:uncharacterized protein (TIGR03382 family)
LDHVAHAHHIDRVCRQLLGIRWTRAAFWLMIGFMRAVIVSMFFAFVVSSTASADTLLKNDGFNTGDTAGFQSGFGAGEIGASRFIAPAAGRQLLRVQLLFGPTAVNRDITLKVYDDSAGTDIPGAELFSGDFTLTGSSSAFSEIDVSTMNIIVPMQFRVGIQFQQAGAPQIARDTDGTVTAALNYIYGDFGGGLIWCKSPNCPLSLMGDWIIRAYISDVAGPQPDGANGGPDAGVGAACTSNVECPAGQFCDPAAHTCTFECRVNSDCGGNGTCNSLGQCLNGNGGGCCQTDHGGPAAAALLGLGVLVLISRRRKR